MTICSPKHLYDKLQSFGVIVKGAVDRISHLWLVMQRKEIIMTYKEKINELYKIYVLKSIAYTKLIPEVYLLNKFDGSEILDKMELAKNEFETAVNNFHTFLIFCKENDASLNDVCVHN